MSEKQHINRKTLQEIKTGNVRSFLDALEKLEPSEISPGMWNKLYALIAVMRNYYHINYWIYDGVSMEYDVTNRTVVPHIIENGDTIGHILEGKKCKTK